MITEIVFPNYLTPSLNEVNKLHWTKRDVLRKKYEKWVWVATRNEHPGPVRLEIYRHSTGTMDDDNFRGGCKQLIDALKNRKVIIDDKDAIIQQKHYEQVKIAKKGPKMTIIKIIDL